MLFIQSDLQLISLSRRQSPLLEQCGVKGLAQGPNSCVDLIRAAPGHEPPTLRVPSHVPWVLSCIYSWINFLDILCVAVLHSLVKPYPSCTIQQFLCCLPIGLTTPRKIFVSFCGTVTALLWIWGNNEDLKWIENEFNSLVGHLSKNL